MAAVAEVDSQLRELEKEITEIPCEDADDFVFLSTMYEEVAQLYMAKAELSESTEEGTESNTKAREASRSAVRSCKTGAERAPSHHDQKGNFWARTAQLSNSEFELFDDQQGLDDAIVYYEKALEFLPPESDDRGPVLLNQANCLVRRFEESSNADRADVDLAIQKAELARSILESSGSDLCIVDNDLSTMYLGRYELFSEAQDLENASSLAERAVKDSDPDSSSLAIRKLNWSNCLRQQFDLYGNRRKLNKAIDELLEARVLCESKSDLPGDKIMSVLSEHLFLRYEASGTLPDLVDSIKMATEALQIAVREGNAGVAAIILSNLAAFQQAFSERTHDPIHLNTAIETAQQALKMLQDDMPHKSMCLANLANMLKDRFQRTKGESEQPKFADLEEAIDKVNEAASIANIRHRDRSIFSDLLSRLLQVKYESCDEKDSDLLMKAISSSESAVENANDLPVDCGSYMIQLGDVRKLWYGHSGLHDAFELAVAPYRQCLQSRMARTWDRVVAGHRAGVMYRGKGLWNDSYEVLVVAVSLMPRLALDSLERGSQQHALAGLSGISMLAASMAIKAGRPADEAFQILERGRGIMADLSIGSTYSDLRRLGTEGEAIYEKVRSMRRAIQGPLKTALLPTENHGASTSSGQLAARIKLVEECEKLERQLQDRYGFNPQLGVTEQNLQKLSAQSSLVAFASEDTGSHALIIRKGSKGLVECLDLPHLTHDKITPHYTFLTQPIENGLRKLEFENYPDVNDKMQELLIWLWDVAVLPVLQHIGVYGTGRSSNPQDLHRVLWITSGVMGLMPLHAAGHHDGVSTENTLSWALSSYSITAKTAATVLQQQIARPWEASTKDIKALVVGMRSTPNMTNFNTIDDHVKAVQSLVSETIVIKDKTRCSSANVIGTMWESEEHATAEVAKTFYRELEDQLNQVSELHQFEGLVTIAWHNAVMDLRGNDSEDIVTWAPFVYFGV
jgi:tetratricopeptide (TPR) repeat protein